jgi:hypothetical protein
MMVEETFSALDLQFADLVGRLAARRSIELDPSSTVSGDFF